MRDSDEAKARTQGLFNITMTTFGYDGTLDLNGLCANVERAIDFGFDGLLIGGTYGEFATLASNERAQIFRTVMQTVGDRVPVLLCSAHSDPDVVRELMALAGELGGLPMVMPPYVSEITQDQIVAFFRDIAPTAKTGVMVYNAPGTGVVMKPETIEAVADIPGIVAIKQGDLAPAVVDRLAATVVGRIRVLAASDLMLPAALAAGFDGLSSTNSGALPELVLGSYRALLRGDLTEAARLHRCWYPLRDLARIYGQPQTVKAAMRLRGWSSACCVRPPLRDLDTQQTETLVRALHEIQENSGIALGLQA